jgi:hypothetical protein
VGDESTEMSDGNCIGDIRRFRNEAAGGVQKNRVDAGMGLDRFQEP